MKRGKLTLSIFGIFGIFDWPIFEPKSILGVSYFSIRNFGVKYLQINQKCIKFPQKVSKIFELDLK